MARPPKGPVGNAPRDLRDDYVGVPPEELPDGPPMRWPPKPKKITKDTFHAKVQGRTSEHRADRSPHYRRGGWVKAASGGAIKAFKQGGKIHDLPYGEGVSKGYIKSISEKAGVKGKDSKDEGEFSGENKRGGHVGKRHDEDGKRKDGGKWMQGAVKHPGALHRSLGVPQGQKIPAAKIEKAAHSSNPTLRKRAVLAETFAKHRPK